jgi:hypothetical protein
MWIEGQRKDRGREAQMEALKAAQCERQGGAASFIRAALQGLGDFDKGVFFCTPKELKGQSRGSRARRGR